MSPVIRNISDTARWAAVYRARESERSDAHFRDPYARRLAGERGEQIATSTRFNDRTSWPWVARTYLFDAFLAEQLKEGVDLVVNLAAGLDARPYRMELAPSLRWVEVDLPEILDYKEEILRGEKPRCALERVRLDLSNVQARRELFAKLGAAAKKALIVTEGLLIYFTNDEVGALARDLAAPASFQRWVIDLASPGLLRMLQKRLGPQLNEANAPLKFGPAEGVAFFAAHGWQAIEVRLILKTGKRLNRLPFLLRLIAMLPESKRPPGNRPWSGICLLGKA